MPHPSYSFFSCYKFNLYLPLFLYLRYTRFFVAAVTSRLSSGPVQTTAPPRGFVCAASYVEFPLNVYSCLLLSSLPVTFTAVCLYLYGRFKSSRTPIFTFFFINFFPRWSLALFSGRSSKYDFTINIPISDGSLVLNFTPCANFHYQWIEVSDLLFDLKGGNYRYPKRVRVRW